MFFKTQVGIPPGFLDFRWWFQDLGRVSEVVQGCKLVREIQAFEDQVGISLDFLTSDGGFKVREVF